MYSCKYILYIQEPNSNFFYYSGNNNSVTLSYKLRTYLWPINTPRNKTEELFARLQKSRFLFAGVSVLYSTFSYEMTSGFKRFAVL